jgi:hypothetical protein
VEVRQYRVMHQNREHRDSRELAAVTMAAIRHLKHHKAQHNRWINCFTDDCLSWLTISLIWIYYMNM